MNAPANRAEPVALEGFGPVDLYQKREKIFTRYVGGFFQRLRFFTGWPLLVGYFALPWLTWGGRQAVLFDLPARQFHIFGVTFWPQDFWLLGWLLIIAAFGLFTVTTLVGRLWCGYTCPQTVWTAIYMWIEQVAEGPRHARIRLDRAPWSLDKLRKRFAKHAMWLGVALATGLTFVGYFTPIRALTQDVLTLDVAGWAAFWVVFFTAATYVNAGWLREQVCIYMCPYARFQSAMFDRDTLIVSYDRNRGEPRGARKRGAAPAVLGDCVDCRLCVQVCPTGIDIRDGLQYQCIGCAHCIDACTEVMGRMGYAPGLIRYTTENALEGRPTRWLRPRSLGYAAALTVMATLLAVAVATRVPFELDVLRDRGSLYQVLPDGTIANEYRLRVLNKSQRVERYELAVRSTLPVTASGDGNFAAAPGEHLDLPLQLRVPAGTAAGSGDVTFELCAAGGGACATETSRFLAPRE